LARVALYFFDTRDGDSFIKDDIGLDLPDLQSAKAQAAKSLAELARDVLPGVERRTLIVEVRNEHQPILTALIVFEAILLIEPVAERQELPPA
jgi:hypothetical protein